MRSDSWRGCFSAWRRKSAREDRLKQVQELRIVIDEVRQEKKVAEITESDYFQRLRGQADQLRSIMAESEPRF